MLTVMVMGRKWVSNRAEVLGGDSHSQELQPWTNRKDFYHPGRLGRQHRGVITAALLPLQEICNGLKLTVRHRSDLPKAQIALPPILLEAMSPTHEANTRF